MIKVDLVSDIGEGFGRYKLCDEEAIIPLLTSVNVACGYHAGVPNIMRKIVKICKENEVGIGAHPGFPDLMGFGRRFMKIKDNELENYLYYQIGALEAFCKLYGLKIQHCIAHGAWGNWLEQDIENARKFVKAIANYNKEIIILAISGGFRIQAAKELNLKVANEFFADREVQNNGRLVPRTVSGSVLHDKDKIVKRVLKAVLENKLISFEGKELNIKVDSICVHGDTPGSLEIIKAIRAALLKEGVVITKFGDFI
ncbi:MAG: LamB/YcsF family protein [Thermoplasmata archaeon]|nr:LamB/YcsF family protein [Thermoplasmata archaeon]